MAEGHASSQQGSADLTPQRWTYRHRSALSPWLSSHWGLPGASSLELLSSKCLPLLLTFITPLLLFLHLLLQQAGPAACLLSAVSKSPHAAQHYSMQRCAARSTFTLITDIHKFCKFDFALPLKTTLWQSEQIYRMEIRLSAALKWIFVELSLKM